MRDARGAAPGQDADAIAGAECLVGFLHHREVASRVEQHRHLDARALVGRALDLVAQDAADDGAADGPGHLAAAAAHVAAGHHAKRRAAGAAHARARTAEAHLAHRLDHAEAHRLLAALVVAIVAAARR